MTGSSGPILGGARRWIARIMLTWGVLAVGMMFVKTPLQFYLMRFMLGAVSGSLLSLHGQLQLAGWPWLFLVEGAPAIMLRAVLKSRISGVSAMGRVPKFGSTK